MIEDDYEVSISAFITSQTGATGHLQLSRSVSLGHLDIAKFAQLHRLIEGFCDSAKALVEVSDAP